MVFVIDTSGMMYVSGPSFLQRYIYPDVKAVLSRKTNMYSSNDVGLVLFRDYPPAADAVVRVIPPTPSLTKLTKLTKDIQFQGGSTSRNAVDEGLLAAVGMFDDSDKMTKDARRDVVLFTNSRPHGVAGIHDAAGPYSTAQVLEMLRERNIHLTVIAPRPLDEIVSLARAAGSETGRSGETLEKALYIYRRLETESDADHSRGSTNTFPATLVYKERTEPMHLVLFNETSVPTFPPNPVFVVKNMVPAEITGFGSCYLEPASSTTGTPGILDRILSIVFEKHNKFVPRPLPRAVRMSVVLAVTNTGEPVYLAPIAKDLEQKSFRFAMVLVTPLKLKPRSSRPPASTAVARNPGAHRPKTGPSGNRDIRSGSANQVSRVPRDPAGPGAADPSLYTPPQRPGNPPSVPSSSQIQSRQYSSPMLTAPLHQQTSASAEGQFLRTMATTHTSVPPIHGAPVTSSLASLNSLPSPSPAARHAKLQQQLLQQQQQQQRQQQQQQQQQQALYQQSRQVPSLVPPSSGFHSGFQMPDLSSVARPPALSTGVSSSSLFSSSSSSTTTSSETVASRLSTEMRISPQTVSPTLQQARFQAYSQPPQYSSNAAPVFPPSLPPIVNAPKPPPPAPRVPTTTSTTTTSSSTFVPSPVIDQAQPNFTIDLTSTNASLNEITGAGAPPDTPTTRNLREQEVDTWFV